MARLCIRIVANHHPTDPSLDPFRTQIGDVVCVVEDGHVFSKGERNCGQYRFIDVAGVPASAFVALTSPRFDINEVMTKVRNAGLDPSVLSNVTWAGRTTATKTQIDAITIVKA